MLIAVGRPRFVDYAASCILRSLFSLGKSNVVRVTGRVQLLKAASPHIERSFAGTVMRHLDTALPAR